MKVARDNKVTSTVYHYNAWLSHQTHGNHGRKAFYDI